MKFNSTAKTGAVEIMADTNYHCIPAHITGSNVVKAGMPITADGTAVPDGAGAVGILLYDVDPAANPNCALVTIGIVNWTKAMAHSGATADAETMKGILPAITFRTNIGVN